MVNVTLLKKSLLRTGTVLFLCTLVFQCYVFMMVNKEYITTDNNNLKDAQYLYFAYGSNMSEQYLRNIRSVTPKAKDSAKLLGYQLGFSMKGINFLEPGFANISKVADKKVSVEGVVYSLDESDFHKILNSESSLYRVEQVLVTPASGKSILAYTLTSPNQGKYTPSRRYLNRVLVGAKENGLSPQYIATLKDTQSAYTPLLSEFMGAIIHAVVHYKSGQTQSLNLKPRSS